MKKLEVKRFSELGVEVERDAVGEAVRLLLGERREPIERELKVVRIGPNPRTITCEYLELESRRTCVVNVGNNRKWAKGMVFAMEEPSGDLEVQKAWEYKGRAPRRKGRW